MNLCTCLYPPHRRWHLHCLWIPRNKSLQTDLSCQAFVFRSLRSKDPHNKTRKLFRLLLTRIRIHKKELLYTTKLAPRDSFATFGPNRQKNRLNPLLIIGFHLVLGLRVGFRPFAPNTPICVLHNFLQMTDRLSRLPKNSRPNHESTAKRASCKIV